MRMPLLPLTLPPAGGGVRCVEPRGHPATARIHARLLHGYEAVHQVMRFETSSSTGGAEGTGVFGVSRGIYNCTYLYVDIIYAIQHAVPTLFPRHSDMVCLARDVCSMVERLELLVKYTLLPGHATTACKIMSVPTHFHLFPSPLRYGGHCLFVLKVEGSFRTVRVRGVPEEEAKGEDRREAEESDFSPHEPSQGAALYC